jgi:hypothetical protein
MIIPEKCFRCGSKFKFINHAYHQQCDCDKPIITIHNDADLKLSYIEFEYNNYFFFFIRDIIIKKQYKETWDENYIYKFDSEPNYKTLLETIIKLENLTLFQ